MGFGKMQTKNMCGTFHDTSTTCTYEREITYGLSSFFLNRSTGEREQNREREKLNGKLNGYHS